MKAPVVKAPIGYCYGFLTCGSETQERDADEAREASCRHEWVFTGTAYGGDDESYRGEGRCYCSICGADGDA